MNKTKEGKQKLTVNGLTPAEERAIIRASKEALAGKNIIGPMDVEDFIKYLRTL